MTWSVHLAATLDGSVGQVIPAAAAGTWKDTINGASEIQASVPTAWWLGLEKRWRTPWAVSLLACWDGTPIVLGPVLDAPDGDDRMVTLNAGGLWSLLDWRTVTDADYASANGLATSKVGLKGLSLGSIARRLVEGAQQRPNGWFPISYASPLEATDHERNYLGFNLSNNTVSKRLKELSEVINGPDIAFRPRWRVPDARVEWVMHHGTEAMPEIWQEHAHVLDLTAPNGGAVTRKVTRKTAPVHRVYGTGAGQDEGTLIVVESQRPPNDVPWLEAVDSDSQVENPALLTSRAKARLAAGDQVQIGASVHASEFPPGTFWAGDAWEVHWPSGWAQLPAGRYRMRCIATSGRFDSEVIDLEFIPEEVLP